MSNEIHHIIAECSKLGKYLRVLSQNSSEYLTGTYGKNAYGEISLSIDLILEHACIEFFNSISSISEIYTEESGKISFNRGSYRIILDPLDGSKNFSMGISYYSCAIAILNPKNEIVGSYVINLADGTEFSAIKGQGAYKNGKLIEVSAEQKMYQSHGIFVGLSKHMREIHILNKLMTQLKSYRASGCSSLDLCCLAAGKADVFIDLSNSAKLVDVLGSVLILSESGGIVTDIHGNKLTNLVKQSPLSKSIYLTKFRTIGVASFQLHNELMSYCTNLYYDSSGE